MSSRARRGVALAFVAAAISGVAVFVNAQGVSTAPDPTVYTTAKNLVATALLAAVAVAAVRRPGGARWRPRGARQVLGVAAVGLVGGAAAFVLFFEGLSRTSSTHAGFLQKTLVIWVAVLAVLLLHERLKARHVLAVAAIVTGLVVLEGGLAGMVADRGELMVAAATLLWSGEVIVVKLLLADLGALPLALYRMGIGVLALLGWIAVTGRWPAMLHLGPAGWAWAGVTGTLLAAYVTTWFAALSRAPAIDATAALSSAALLTAGLSALTTLAVPAPAAVAGMALLAAGAAIVVAGSRRPARPVP
ncbi:hypothetical protein Athai_08850 [Actinocatenispora thailandica]|uniref:EamA domain-containing protein n=1 Tax=Actinocatenispora thailandica TaxID=227318 RepID=A0A7R7HUT3_9ACTN|nr:DMT family transporter [Actinocatenispora thailandica]BCJ33382.1 hypothetical protein Athai_08850 [Actinocatenispora thailandica]